MIEPAYLFPFYPNQEIYWISDGKIKKGWFKGLRQDKGYSVQVIARYTTCDGALETAVCPLNGYGVILFDDYEDAEKALLLEKELVFADKHTSPEDIKEAIDIIQRVADMLYAREPIKNNVLSSDRKMPLKMPY